MSDEFLQQWLTRVEAKIDRIERRQDEEAERLTRLEEGRRFGDRDAERAEVRVVALEGKVTELEAGVLKLSTRQKLIIAAIGLGGGALGGIGGQLVTTLMGGS